MIATLWPSERRPVSSIRPGQSCLPAFLSTLKSRGCISLSLNHIFVPKCLCTLGRLVFSFLSPPGPCKSVWLMTEMSLSSNTSVGLGRGQAVNKPLRGWFYILLFHHKNLNFPFCGKQNPLSVPHQRDCGLWIIRFPREILKINRLLGWSGWDSPCPLSIGEWRFSTSIPSDLAANFMCRWGNWSAYEWFANPQMCGWEALRASATGSAGSQGSLILTTIQGLHGAGGRSEWLSQITASSD